MRTILLFLFAAVAAAQTTASYDIRSASNGGSDITIDIRSADFETTAYFVSITVEAGAWTETTTRFVLRQKSDMIPAPLWSTLMFLYAPGKKGDVKIRRAVIIPVRHDQGSEIVWPSDES